MHGVSLTIVFSEHILLKEQMLNFNAPQMPRDIPQLPRLMVVDDTERESNNEIWISFRDTVSTTTLYWLWMVRELSICIRSLCVCVSASSQHATTDAGEFLCVEVATLYTESVSK